MTNTGPEGAIVDGGLTPLDLLLGEGSPDEREALRQRIGDEPHEALAMAETTAFLEAFRQVRVEPGPLFAAKLADVVRRAERRAGPARPSGGIAPFVWAAVAAAATWFVLVRIDPLHRFAPCPSSVALRWPADQEAGGADEVAAAPVRTRREMEWESAVEEMRRRLGLESADRLREALEDGLRPMRDPLEGWLDPRNALALLRVGHEVCSQDELRTAVVARRGGMLAADARAQLLADGIVRDLAAWLAPGREDLSVANVSLAVRAIVAAGAVAPRRASALALGSDWIAERIAAGSDEDLVAGLAALVEVAAVSGRHGSVVESEGARLVDRVLVVDDMTWGRRRPLLISGRLPAAVLADAARVLGFLPAFGVDAERCQLVRQLVVGHLRERRERRASDGPEVLAAMLFGVVDLLRPEERDEVERELRRWNPARLAPDYVTVLQMAWGFAPGRLGSTGLQRQLRNLAVLAEPDDLGGRAAFCLCLATNSAGWRGAPSVRDLGD